MFEAGDSPAHRKQESDDNVSSKFLKKLKARERANRLDHVEERDSENEFSDYGDDDKYRIKKGKKSHRNASPAPPSEFFGSPEIEHEDDRQGGKKRSKKSKKKAPGILDSSPHDLVGDDDIGGRHVSPTKVAHGEKKKAPHRSATTA